MSKRRATPPNLARASAATCASTPSSTAIASAPVALTTLCTPRSGNRTATRWRPSRSTSKWSDPWCAVTSTARTGRVGAGAVGECAVACCEARGARVVGAHHLRAGDLREVAVESGLDRLDRAVVVEVVGLDVREDRAVQRQLQVRAVALVGLDDEPFAAGPLRAGSHVGDIAADDEARPPPRLGQDQHEHRRRGGLAVGAGDGQRLGLGADRRQHPGPTEREDALLPRLVELVEIGAGSRWTP